MKPPKKDGKGRLVVVPKAVAKGEMGETLEPEIIDDGMGETLEIPSELPISCDKRLTKSEIRLLSALAVPQARMLDIVRLCQVAGIGRDTYYRAFKKPWFVEAHNSLALTLIKQHSAPLVNAGIVAAQLGSFHHWKVLMEMSGLYDPKRLVLESDEAGGAGSITIRFADPRNRKDVTPKEEMLPFTDSE